MTALRFNALLQDHGIEPRRVRLLRHETRRHGLTPYALWRDDPDRFDDYQRVQKRDRQSWFDRPIWASFVGTPAGKTLFVGLFSAAIEGSVPDGWLDPISLRDARSLADYDLYRIHRIEPLSDYAGRLAIAWGEATRSWSQKPEKQDKLITELRDAFIEPAFPGYVEFVAQLSEIESLPPGWRASLKASRGVYLLSCPRTREQYVGAATGSDGFLGRWQSYVRDGHGGNVGLRIRQPADYRVSILQVAGSADDRNAILRVEALWKAKLQSREMGLNRN